MIKSLSIKNVAIFNNSSQVLRNLSQFNFIYGANGSGKTTISRIIANETEHLSCQVQWKDELMLQTMVYNHDFIDRNFNQSSEMKGIFTLG
ncbi:MAG: AAA family ATPase [Chitinivibrionales bacterium]|nr:AAA family ATPase [Chitinivibrionales bacterium]